MSTKSLSDASSENRAENLDTTDSVAVMEPKMSESTGPCCENCGAPMKAGSVTICRSCGWYASLGRCVEVDPNWKTEDENAENAQTGTAVSTSHIGVWLRLLPMWAWVVIASVIAVIAESIVVRFATPHEIGGLRTKWSLLQLLAGVAVFFGCHLFNFVQQVADDSDVGVLDVVMRPIKLWLRTMQYLPTKLWLVNSAACGLTAAVMSVLVIGALPYDRLWDWGFKAPVKQNLMGAVMDRAKKLEGRGADNLEDAIGDFAGEAGVDDEGMPKAKPAAPREKADCVILGYELDRDGRLDRLVLATAHNKKLVFAGKVNPTIDEIKRTELLQELKRIQVREPFIQMQADSAKWVKAKHACRVSYTERMKGGQLRDVQWETMLGTIRGQ
jgi:ATP dependent DNA ligase C terminal region